MDVRVIIYWGIELTTWNQQFKWHNWLGLTQTVKAFKISRCKCYLEAANAVYFEKSPVLLIVTAARVQPRFLDDLSMCKFHLEINSLSARRL